MPKGVKDPEELFSEIVQDYRGLFSDDLVSVILYGSAAGEEYRPGGSDINFMVVLSEEGIEQLDRAFPVVKKWQKRQVAIPLFLTEAYIERSLDAFPIEYLNFQHAHKVAYGKNVLAKLQFDSKLIRLQCEREIKGKLLLLREAYMEAQGRSKALKAVIRNSFPAFTAIFKALLHLRGVEPPMKGEALIRAASESFDLDSETFQKLNEIRAEKIKLSDQEIRRLFAKFLREVRKLSKSIDAMGG